MQARAGRQGRADWSLHFIDSTTVRAHQHAAGARKARRRLDGEAFGCSRGWLSTKTHVRAEGLGKPVTFTLTGGEVHDSMAFTALVSTGWMKQFRRITTRYEKRAANYLAMITVAAILLWL